jgi:hypothetical protein
LKKLAIDVKDNFAVVVAGGDFRSEFIKIEFNESDFAGEDDRQDTMHPCLFDMGNDRIIQLYKEADQRIVSVPIRFSLVKPLSIDTVGIDKYGDDFLQWEATQQIPEDLGEFIFGFQKLRESFDGKIANYLYYASPRNFTDNLLNFASPDSEHKPALGSEAFGLLNIINSAAEREGLCAAISLEHDGVSVVLSRDGIFEGARFISAESVNIGEEIMYYILGQVPDDIAPRVLICGDLNQLELVGAMQWAEMLTIPDSLKPSIMSGVGGPGIFTTAAGLIIDS